MSENRRERGERFEDAAARYLERNGYTILHRQWRAGRYEIDLIARHGDIVTFVEVKASTTGSFGHPAARVDQRKQARLIAAAQAYVNEYDLAGCDLRFDVITFHRGELEHFENAFTLPE